MNYFSYDGYSLVVPEKWSASTTDEVFVETDSNSVDIIINTDSTFALGEEAFFKTLVDTYKSEGFAATDAGTFKTDNLTGYYLDFYLIRDKAYKAPTNITIIVYPKDGVAYSLLLYRRIKSDDWDEAMKVAASFKFE